MRQSESSLFDRRSFLAGSAAALAASAVTLTSSPLSAATGKKLRVAIVGTGSRGGSTWGRPAVQEYSDVVEVVGLCDINRKRVEFAQKYIGVEAPTFVDFDQMIAQVKPDAVIITTIDATHYRYNTRAMELGCDVISEKPMCTDEEQCQAIIDTQKATGRKVTVTFNARHSLVAKKVKQLLLEKAVGDLISVDFHEYLNTSHGADYFRRWHRLKENSGTLLCHKASHHFDQANWWIDSDPAEVMATGDLKFYGRNGAHRGTNCRKCPFQQQCKFYWDVTRNKHYVDLYVNCESEDGYFRDGCVFAENTNIYDVMSVIVRYENDVRMTYTANTYIPYEGQSISFNGTKGRLDAITYEGGGKAINEIRLTPTFGTMEVISDFGQKREGGHGGADSSIRDLVFRGEGDSEGLSLSAGLRAGALSSLIGIAAYHSIERDGTKIHIADLAKL